MAPLAPSIRYTPYAPITPTTNFPVGFPIFDNADVRLLHEGQPVAFTVTATYEENVSTNAVCVASVGLTGMVEVVGSRTPRRTDQYMPGQPLPVQNHNYSLNRLTAESQEARRDIDRSIKVTIGSANPGDLVPVPGRVISFDADGNAVMAANSAAEATMEAIRSEAASAVSVEARDASVVASAISQEARDASVAASEISEEARDDAQDAELGAQAAETASGLNAAAAQAANPVYPDAVTGLAAHPVNGSTFPVEDTIDGVIVVKLYRNVAGVATYTGFAWPSFDAYKALAAQVHIDFLEVDGLRQPVLLSHSGRGYVLGNGGARVDTRGNLVTGTWGFAVAQGAPGTPLGLTHISESGCGSQSRPDPMKVTGDAGAGTEALFTDAQYQAAQALVEAERKRLMSLDLSALKRVLAGWRMNPRTGQSFEARDNITRLYMTPKRIAANGHHYYGASISPDIGGVDTGTTFVTFSGGDGADTRQFYALRDRWTAGTGTDQIYTDQEIIDGDFAGNSRGGGPAAIAVWARQWLQREYNELPDVAQTDVIDVPMSSAKSEGATADVYDGVGRDRSIDMIRVFKEAVAANTVAPGETLTIPSAGADKGVEVFDNLHGQNPNSAGITGYPAAIEDFVAAFAAALADPVNGLGQTEPFAFTMMQPGALGWSNGVNITCKEMAAMADDVTGPHKYTFLVGGMWDTSSFRTVPFLASFTGSMSGTTLTVTAVSSGTIEVGQYIQRAAGGIAVGIQITGLGPAQAAPGHTRSASRRRSAPGR